MRDDSTESNRFNSVKCNAQDAAHDDYVVVVQSTWRLCNFGVSPPESQLSQNFVPPGGDSSTYFTVMGAHFWKEEEEKREKGCPPYFGLTKRSRPPLLRAAELPRLLLVRSPLVNRTRPPLWRAAHPNSSAYVSCCLSLILFNS
eukprot:scaffold3622_cov145-Skeletonema_dohrnii-CCMP3373.AAC.5